MSSTYFLGSSSAVSAPFWDFPGLEYWIQGMSSIKARLQSIGSLFDSTFPLSERKGPPWGSESVISCRRHGLGTTAISRLLVATQPSLSSPTTWRRRGFRGVVACL